jgi:hypothetical protein
MAALRFVGVRVLSSTSLVLLAMVASLPWANAAVSAERALTVDDFLRISSVGNAAARPWTPRGAHLLLQVRVQVLNDELGTAFRRWYPKFGSDQRAQLAT